MLLSLISMLLQNVNVVINGIDVTYIYSKPGELTSKILDEVNLIMAKIHTCI